MCTLTIPRNNLKKIRLHEGLLITELAGLSGVSGRTIKNLEQHKINSRRETKHKIVNGINRNPNRTREHTYEEIFGDDLFDL